VYRVAQGLRRIAEELEQEPISDEVIRKIVDLAIDDVEDYLTGVLPRKAEEVTEYDEFAGDVAEAILRLWQEKVSEFGRDDVVEHVKKLTI